MATLNPVNLVSTTTLVQVQLQHVIDELNQFATSDLIEIYNEYAEQNSYERIYDNDDLILDDMFTSNYDAIRAAFYGDYNPSHAYFTFNGYANLQSFEYLDSEHCPIDIEELAQWLINEEKLVDYDIDVITLDDMLTSIEDNITDDEYMFKEICKLLSLKAKSIENVMSVLADYNYKQLLIVITHLGINYE